MRWTPSFQKAKKSSLWDTEMLRSQVLSDTSKKDKRRTSSTAKHTRNAYVSAFTFVLTVVCWFYDDDDPVDGQLVNAKILRSCLFVERKLEDYCSSLLLLAALLLGEEDEWGWSRKLTWSVHASVCSRSHCPTWTWELQLLRNACGWSCLLVQMEAKSEQVSFLLPLAFSLFVCVFVVL